MPSRATQFLAAVALVIALFVATVYVWNRDETRFLELSGLAPAKKETVVLVSRVEGKGGEVVTNDPSSTRYKRVPQSVNQEGGTEFAYSFIVGNVGGEGFQVFRGDKVDDDGGEISSEYCPRIDVSTKNAKHATIKVTLSSVDYPSQAETTAARENMEVFFDNVLPSDRPTHVCVAVRDTNPSVRDLAFREKIRVDLFLNGTRAETRYLGTDCDLGTNWSVDSANVCRAQLVPNRGAVFFSADTSTVIEGLRYHNWFLSEDEVRKTFEDARETSSYSSDQF